MLSNFKRLSNLANYYSSIFFLIFADFRCLSENVHGEGLNLLSPGELTQLSNISKDVPICGCKLCRRSQYFL